MFIHKEKIETLVEEGYLSKREMEDGLSIYKYTAQTSFEKKWDNITLRCRGLVLDEDCNIVANCMPKFFNYEEIIGGSDRLPDVNFDQPFRAFEKYDGSLIQIFNYNGKLYYTSSGAYDNKHTDKAKEIMESMYPEQLEHIKHTNKINFIFELIAPLTRVVVNYHGVNDMRLVAIRTVDGFDLDLNLYKYMGFNVADEVYFNTIEDLIKMKQSPYHNLEGYVVKFQDGDRVKFKYDEYFTLHATITNLSKPYIWKCLSEGIKLNWENIPDEYYDTVNDWIGEIENDFKKLCNRIYGVFNAIPKDMLKDRKEFALHVMRENKDISAMLFKLLDGCDIDKMIWNKIKPVGDDNEIQSNQ